MACLMLLVLIAAEAEEQKEDTAFVLPEVVEPDGINHK